MYYIHTTVYTFEYFACTIIIYRRGVSVFHSLCRPICIYTENILHKSHRAACTHAGFYSCTISAGQNTLIENIKYMKKKLGK